MNKRTIITSLLKQQLGIGLFGSNLMLMDTSPFFDLVRLSIVNRGTLRTIKWLKDLRLMVHRYVSGNPINPGFISTNKAGVPKAFGPLVPYLTMRDPNSIRLALTLLQVARILSAWNDPSIESITAPPKIVDAEYRLLVGNQPAIISKLGFWFKLPQWSVPHQTSRSGPQGLAMYTAMAELRNLPENLIENLKVIGGEAFTEYISGQLKIPPTKFWQRYEIKESRKGLLRKQSVVQDLEGKSRIIAMADYWSQTVLQPWHKAMLECLRPLESDCTFGQSIAPFGPDSQNYFSFDLTAATDRVPVQLYYDIIKVLFGLRVADAWKFIMVHLPFDWDGRNIMYSTGQPMGMYSSWTFLAFAHHIIVQHAALLIGLSDFKDYRILGDDIVIKNDLVAASYLKVLNTLGIENNQSKTQVSKDTFEFAKRLFYKNEEVTGFPVSAQMSDQINWLNIYSALGVASRRGYEKTLQMDPIFLQSLFKILFGTFGSVKRNLRAARSVLFQMLLRERNCDWRRIAKLFGVDLSCNNITKFKNEFELSQLEQQQDEVDKIANESIGRTHEYLDDTMLGNEPTTSHGDALVDPLILALTAKLDGLYMNTMEFLQIASQPLNQGQIQSIKEKLQWIESREFRVFNPDDLFKPRRRERGIQISTTIAMKTIHKLVKSIEPKSKY